MLLYRRVPLRRLFPAGVATGLCITGLGVFSSFVFSGQIIDGQKSYGPAGVVLALISFLVGFGVCLHAGAVFGRCGTTGKTNARRRTPKRPDPTLGKSRSAGS
jgi:membrane protein